MASSDPGRIRSPLPRPATRNPGGRNAWPPEILCGGRPGREAPATIRRRGQPGFRPLGFHSERTRTCPDRAVFRRRVLLERRPEDSAARAAANTGEGYVPGEAGQLRGQGAANGGHGAGNLPDPKGTEKADPGRCETRLARRRTVQMRSDHADGAGIPRTPRRGWW